MDELNSLPLPDINEHIGLFDAELDGIAFSDHNAFDDLLGDDLVGF